MSTPKAPSRNWPAVLCLAGVAVSAAMIVAGAAWNMFSRPANVWSAEDAAEYKQANQSYHMMIAAHGHEGEKLPNNEVAPAASPQQLEAARQRVERSAAALEAAQELRNQAGTTVIRIGLAAAALFGVGYWATRG